MAKRFTDTDIWEQDWFIDLPNKYKLFWNYIKDKCDNVGIWRPNKSLAQRIIGEPLNLAEFMQFVNIEKQRIVELPTGRWFVREFFVFQYGETFSPTSHVHKGALKQLIANGLHIRDLPKIDCGKLKMLDIQQLKEVAYDKDIDKLNIAFGNPSKRVKDKDKNKDKDIEYIIEQIRELVREVEGCEISEDDYNLYAMIVQKMVDVFLKHFPNYYFHRETDYKAALQIAYRIAEMKSWKRDSVLNGNLTACVSEWDRIISEIILPDNWFNDKTLSDFAGVKIWQKIVQKINKPHEATKGFVAGKTAPERGY